MPDHFIKETKTAAIILAAGQASRFGSPKQLLKIDNQTFVERCITHAHAAGCDPIIVVTGAYHEEITQLGLSTSALLTYHANWQHGMGRSIAHGATKLNESKIHWDAVYILLADQPSITPSTLLHLKDSLSPPGITITLCKNANSQGPPALFSKSHLSALCQLKHDEGAKSIVTSHPDQLAIVEAPETAWDIDTPSNWESFCKNQPR